VFGAWIKLIRPTNWVKNFFVLAPLLFAQQLFVIEMIVNAAIAFIIFCFLSSSVYVFNDVLDAKQDRLHPLKSKRPVAAGVIQKKHALAGSLLLAIGSACSGFYFNLWFGIIGLSYLVLNFFYSIGLKKRAFLDVIIIGLGFVLRVVAGAVAIGVEFSSWLVVCTFCLACLLGLGKRRHELESLNNDLDSKTRTALAGYTKASLRIAEWICAVVTLACYIFYTLAPGTVAKFGTTDLVYTFPFCVFGILRYLRLVKVIKNRVPTDALVTDLQSLLNLLGWAVTVTVVLYP
jgi:4-hydroxybenzoate polyprenyltransferase